MTKEGLLVNLYEMTKEFENELDAFDAVLNPTWEKNADGEYITEDGEVITPAYREWLLEQRFRALDEMEEDIQVKAENVAVYIKEQLALAEKMKAEEDRLRARRKAKENTAAYLKKYLMNCMEAAHLKKIDMPRAVISRSDGRVSLEIPDENAFIAWAESTDHNDLLKYAKPEPRKDAIKSFIKSAGADAIPEGLTMMTCKPYVTIK